MGAFSTIDLEQQAGSGFVPVGAPQPAALDAEEQEEAVEAVNEPDEDAKRKAHEAAEAKRKAAHDAKFAERRAKEQAERDRVSTLSDAAAMDEAMQHVSKGFERLTRRNMSLLGAA